MGVRVGRETERQYAAARSGAIWLRAAVGCFACRACRVDQLRDVPEDVTWNQGSRREAAGRLIPFTRPQQRVLTQMHWEPRLH